MDNFYTFSGWLWIESQIHGKHGILSPKIVDNHVENVDFPVDEPLHIHDDYTFFRHEFDAETRIETNSMGKAIDADAVCGGAKKGN